MRNLAKYYHLVCEKIQSVLEKLFSSGVRAPSRVAECKFLQFKETVFSDGAISVATAVSTFLKAS